MNTQNDKRSLMTKKKMADALLLLMKKTQCSTTYQDRGY